MSNLSEKLSNKDFSDRYAVLAQQQLQNPLFDQLESLGALQGIHLMQTAPEQGGTTLVVADTSNLQLDLPKTVKQAVVAWGDHVHHFFFGSDPAAEGKAFLKRSLHGMEKDSQGNDRVIKHPEMPPLIEAEDEHCTELMMYVGKRYLEKVLPRVSHLGLVEERENASLFLNLTAPFLGTVALRRKPHNLKLHTL